MKKNRKHKKVLNINLYFYWINQDQWVIKMEQAQLGGIN